MHNTLGLIVVMALDNGLADAVAHVVSELGGAVFRGSKRIVGAGPNLLGKEVRLTACEAAVAYTALAGLYNTRFTVIWLSINLM